VISPEGCAAILWRDRAEGPKAAAALKITAGDCHRLSVIDEVIPEPPGGAHRHPAQAITNLGASLRRHLDQLLAMDGETVRKDRYRRFRNLGTVLEQALASADRSASGVSDPGA